MRGLHVLVEVPALLESAVKPLPQSTHPHTHTSIPTHTHTHMHTHTHRHTKIHIQGPFCSPEAEALNLLVLVEEVLLDYR